MAMFMQTQTGGNGKTQAENGPQVGQDAGLTYYTSTKDIMTYSKGMLRSKASPTH